MAQLASDLKIYKFDNEFDIAELIRCLWSGRWLIVIFTVIFSTCATAYAFLATPTFRAEALLQIREQGKTGGGFSGLVSQFGGLANLAGVSLDSDSSDREIVLATLQSRAVIEPFLNEEKILPELYESQWDSKRNRWKSDNPSDVPSLWQAYNDFTSSILKITNNRKTNLITVAIEWRNPEEAQRWVTNLIARTNEYLRADTVRESERNLTYLSEQARQVSEVELKQSLFSLMEGEQKKLMLANGGDEYALKTIDAAVVPKMKLRPKRAMILMIGFFMGIICGCTVVFIKAALSTLNILQSAKNHAID